MVEDVTVDEAKLEEKVNTTFQGLEQLNVMQVIGTKVVEAYRRNGYNVTEMLGYAEDNLKASRWLKDNGYIALSIYHLEQSAELITKTIFIILDLPILPAHNQVELIKDLKEKVAKKYGTGFAVFFASVDNAISFYESKDKEELAKLSEESINEYLQAIDILKAFASPDNEYMRKIVNQSVDLVKTNVHEVPRNFTITPDRMITLLKSSMGLPCVMLVGIVTSPHEAFTRYPGKSISPKDYNSGSVGIVKLYDKIYGVIDDYIKDRKATASVSK